MVSSYPRITAGVIGGAILSKSILLPFTTVCFRFWNCSATDRNSNAFFLSPNYKQLRHGILLYSWHTQQHLCNQQCVHSKYQRLSYRPCSNQCLPLLSLASSNTDSHRTHASAQPVIITSIVVWPMEHSIEQVVSLLHLLACVLLLGHPLQNPLSLVL